jgi:hypothetical protein
MFAASGFAACVSEGEGSDDPAPNPEPVSAGQQAQSLVTGPIGPIFWPTAPITWNGTIGTWPIAVWSPAAIDWLAVSIPGATNLSVSLATMDGLALTGFPVAPLTTPLAATINAGPWLGGLTPYYGMLPWMYGLGSYPSYGVPGYVYGLDYYPYVGSCAGCGTLGMPLVDGLAYPNLFPAGVVGTSTALGAAALTTPFLGTTGLAPAMIPSASFLTPTLADNALYFSTFPTFAATTPFLMNVTFDAAAMTTASLSSMSLFASSAALDVAATSAAIQATTFPIMGFPVVLP